MPQLFDAASQIRYASGYTSGAFGRQRMKLYTKAGDDGFTRRGDGRRLSKNDPLMQAVGAIDELDAHIGLCRQGAKKYEQEEIVEALATIQTELYSVGSLLVGDKKTQQDARSRRTSGELSRAVGRMERDIDAACRKLPQLTYFVSPGGCEPACRLHVARTVCRRAERSFVAAAECTEVPPAVLQYLNRLSDLLFVLARLANQIAGQEETLRQD